jgi:hypothetical protein
VDDEEHGGEGERRHPQSRPAAPGCEPRRERDERDRRRPLHGGPEAEREARERPALAVGEREPGGEQCGRHEVELELPVVRVRGPETDEDGEPRRPARAQRPDGGDGHELERDHQERVRRLRRAAGEQGLEREQEHGAGRVLGVRVTAVEERVPLLAVDLRRIDVCDRAEPEVDEQEARLKRDREREQGGEPEPPPRAPGNGERGEPERALEEEPRDRRAPAVARLGGDDAGDAERERDVRAPRQRDHRSGGTKRALKNPCAPSSPGRTPLRRTS